MLFSAGPVSKASLFDPMRPSHQLKSLLTAFPTLRYGFGYGSGVITQKGYDYSKQSPMLDFIFAVDDPTSWHKENLQRNPHTTIIPNIEIAPVS